MPSDQFIAARAAALAQAGIDDPHGEMSKSPSDGDYHFRFFDEDGNVIGDVVIERTEPDPERPPVDWS